MILGVPGHGEVWLVVLTATVTHSPDSQPFGRGKSQNWPFVISYRYYDTNSVKKMTQLHDSSQNCGSRVSGIYFFWGNFTRGSMEIWILWGHQSFSIDVDPAKPVRCAMIEIERRTNVPVCRQRLVARRHLLEPDDLWPNEIKQGTKLLLSGEVETPPAEIEGFSPGSGPPEEWQTNLTGLPNFGNTSYINSILQVLRHLPDFVNLILSKPPLVLDREDEDFGDTPMGGVKSDETGQLPGKVQERCASSALEPKVTKDQQSSAEEPDVRTLTRLEIASKFVAFLRDQEDPDNFSAMINTFTATFDQEMAEIGDYLVQNDVGDAWTFLIECLSDALGPDIADLFTVSILVTGKHLGHVVVREDTFVMLGCSIDPDLTRLEEGIGMGRTKGDSQLSVKSEMTRLPKFLVVQLQRFDYGVDEGTVVKIPMKVETTTGLDVINWVSDDLKARIFEERGTENGKLCGCYEMRAIIAHAGAPDDGHYVAFVKINQMWLKFDDMEVEEVKEESLISLASEDGLCTYLVFYEAR